MRSLSWQRPEAAHEGPRGADGFALGRRLNALRKRRKLTLQQVSDAVGVGLSQLSGIENGKREAKISTIQKLAELYEVTVDELLTAAPGHRVQLEVELDAHMKSPLAQSRGIPPIRVGPRTPNDVLEAMVSLYRELNRVAEEHLATPEEARRANTELRRQMREINNYFGALELEASRLLEAIGHDGGPLTAREIRALTKHLDFTVHHVDDLPHSTRSVTDLRQRRIYVARRASQVGHDPRSVLLQALGHQVLGHTPPRNYAEFLTQRVETNYLAGALTLPEASVLEHLREAMDARDLSAEGLQHAFGVSFETAAHRITNLATEHFGIPVHFQKVHETGTIYKAYENDGILFPMDRTGAIEGQPVCRYFASRRAFEVGTPDEAYYQYTDTPRGTFFSAVRLERTSQGLYSLGLGTDFKNAKYFRGRDTRVREKSRCPEESCCRLPPVDLMQQWGGMAWPSARARTHMMAALPPGAFPGVDETEVYAFLQAHAGEE